MPKIKVICRDSNNYIKSSNKDIEKVYRNTNPTFHPHQKAREYVKAINSAKMEKIFAKPFIFALENHTDGVKCMAKNYKSLSEIVSGSFDGQLLLWDISNKKPIFEIPSSHDFVKDVCFSNNGLNFFSIGDDNKINLWNKAMLFDQQIKSIDSTYTNNLDLSDNIVASKSNFTPKQSYTFDGFLDSIDHCYINDRFSTAGQVVAIWDYNRNKPITTFNNSLDGFIKVKYK